MKHYTYAEFSQLPPTQRKALPLHNFLFENQREKFDSVAGSLASFQAAVLSKAGVAEFKAEWLNNIQPNVLLEMINLHQSLSFTRPYILPHKFKADEINAYKVVHENLTAIYTNEPRDNTQCQNPINDLAKQNCKFFSKHNSESTYKNLATLVFALTSIAIGVALLAYTVLCAPAASASFATFMAYHNTCTKMQITLAASIISSKLIPFIIDRLEGKNPISQYEPLFM